MNELFITIFFLQKNKLTQVNFWLKLTQVNLDDEHNVLIQNKEMFLPQSVFFIRGCAKFK